MAKKIDRRETRRSAICGKI